MATITIRDLLPRVQMFRPNDVIEAKCIWALQEAARDMARFSGLAELVLTPINLPANSSTQSAGLANTDATIQVKRIKAVRLGAVPNPSSYLGTWDADANSPTLSDGSEPSANGFFIVTTAGTTTLGGVSTWNVGDIVYSNGTSWVRIDREAYTTCWPQNKPSTDRNINQPQEGINFPLRFSERDGTAYFYPRPQYDIPIEYTVSYEPVGNEFATINMSTDAIEGIVYGALETIFRLPGSGQDLKQAEIFRIRYLKQRANMKNLATYGDNGNTVIMPNNFLGRTNRLGPWRTTGWWL